MVAADSFQSVIAFFNLRSVILLCGLSILWSIVRSYRRLRQFKGPWLGSFSKLWMIRSTYRGRMHLDVAEVCKKYGTYIIRTQIYAVGIRSDMEGTLARSSC